MLYDRLEYFTEDIETVFLLLTFIILLETNYDMLKLSGILAIHFFEMFHVYITYVFSYALTKTIRGIVDGKI